jgi:hypothetical protein
LQIFWWLFPGGDRVALEGLASLYLFNMSNKAIKLDFRFSVNDSDGKQVLLIDY